MQSTSTTPTSSSYSSSSTPIEQTTKQKLPTTQQTSRTHHPTPQTPIFGDVHQQPPADWCLAAGQSYLAHMNGLFLNPLQLASVCNFFPAYFPAKQPRFPLPVFMGSMQPPSIDS